MTPSRMMSLTAVVIMLLAILQLPWKASGASYGGLFECPPHFKQREDCYHVRVGFSRSEITANNFKRKSFAEHSCTVNYGAAVAAISNEQKAKDAYLKNFQVWNVAENRNGNWVDEFGVRVATYWSYQDGVPMTRKEACSSWQAQTKEKKVVLNDCINHQNEILCEAVRIARPPSEYSQCPKGFKLTSPGRCLAVFTEQKKMTVTDARLKCRSYSAYIAKMTSLEDFREHRRYLLRVNPDVSYWRNTWIDIEHAEHKWVTESGRRSSHIYYAKESYDGPYFSAGKCTSFKPNQPKGDCQSTSKKAVLCETVPSRPIRKISDALKCPSGYTPTEEPGRCLKYINTRDTRVQAQRRCQQEGGNIASANSRHSSRVLASFMRSKGVNTVWLDVTQTNGIWASETFGSHYAQWWVYPPSNDSCTTINDNGIPQVSHCFSKGAVICEITTECGRGYVLNRGRCYRYFPQYPLNKWDAEKFCKSLDAKLPLIRDAEENHVIHQMIRSVPNAYAWLQNTDDVVPNNFNVNFDGAWGVGEPNGGNQENCSAVFPNGKWLDITCKYTLPVLCYKSLQVVKTEFSVPDVATWYRLSGRQFSPRSGYSCGEHWEMVNGKCYRVFTTPRNFLDGLRHCREHYASFVTLPYHEEREKKLRKYIREMITGPTTVWYNEAWGIRQEHTICTNNCHKHANRKIKQAVICVKDRFCPDPYGDYYRDSVLKEKSPGHCIVYEHDKDCFGVTCRSRVCARHGAQLIKNPPSRHNYYHFGTYDVDRFLCEKRSDPYLNCPKDWQNRVDGLQAASIDGRCFLHLGKRMNWFDAREACWNYGGHLIENVPHQSSFGLLSTQFRHATSYWTGYNDINVESRFVGSYSNVLASDQNTQNVTGFQFRGGQPNGNHGENCMRANRKGEGDDYDCNREFNVICQAHLAPPGGADRNSDLNVFPWCKEGFIKLKATSNVCLKVFQETATYNEAVSNCQKHSSTLVKPLTLLDKEINATSIWKVLGKGLQDVWTTPRCHAFSFSYQVVHNSTCTKAAYICQYVQKFSFTNSDPKRCPPGLTMRSLPDAPITFTTAHPKVARDMCLRNGMSLPDEFSQHCLFDAMRKISAAHPNFVSKKLLGHGLHLSTGGTSQGGTIMNYIGRQYSTTASSSSLHKVICADFSGYKCNQVTVRLPAGVGPSFTTRDPQEAQRLCQKNLPEYSNRNHMNCIVSFVNKAKKVQDNGNYGSTGLLMGNFTGNGGGAYVSVVVDATGKVTAKSVSATSGSGSPKSHVLCVN